MDAAPAAQPTGDRVGEMLVKPLPEGTELPPHSNQQVSVYSQPSLALEKLYTLPVYGRSFSGRNAALERPQLTVRFKADVDLPVGQVKLFERTADGSSIIAGESHLKQTTRGDYAELMLGQAQAVRIERTLVSSKQQEKHLTSQWQATVHNDQDKAITLILIERDNGLLNITDVKGATQEGMRHLNINVPAKSSKEVSFNATYRL